MSFEHRGEDIGREMGPRKMIEKRGKESGSKEVGGVKEVPPLPPLVSIVTERK